MKLINIILIILAIFLIVAILLQQRGTALGGAFGGEGNVYRTRRGAERMLFIFTIIISCLFVGIAIVNLIIK
jgi:preprotein translocase subunit SecG